MQKKKLKIYFTDFWLTFNKTDNYFTNIISDEFDIEVTKSNPDILFYSVLAMIL